MTLDLVIENGLVVDGAGTPGKRADVGIAGTRIVAIGDLKAADAGRRLDATGCIVAPGFIDIHNHSDLALLADGRAESMVARAPLEVRRSWARLIRQVYEVDPLLCPHCGGTMKVIAVIERPAIIRQILEHLGLASTPPSLRAPPDPPDGRGADPPREWSYEPKHFTAELAKIAKAHQVSTTWAQRLGQNVPVCATFFLPPFLWIWGISLRAWRALRFKCTFWDEPLFDDLPVPDPVRA